MGVLRDHLVRPFGDDLSTLQHTDGVGDAGDHVHVVFHHEDGAVGAHLLDQLGDPVHVFVTHALCGLVQQHQLGVHGQGGGNFQSAFAAIGQLHRRQIGHAAQIHFIQQGHGLVVELVEHALGAPKVHGHAGATLQRNAHVLQHGQVGEGGRNLERPHQTAARHLRGLFGGDVLAIEQDLPTCGNQEFGEQVEDRGFACTVGPDERVDLPTLHIQVDTVDCDKTLELLHELAGFKNIGAGHLVCSVSWEGEEARNTKGYCA